MEGGLRLQGLVRCTLGGIFGLGRGGAGSSFLASLGVGMTDFKTFRDLRGWSRNDDDFGASSTFILNSWSGARIRCYRGHQSSCA